MKHVLYFGLLCAGLLALISALSHNSLDTAGHASGQAFTRLPTTPTLSNLDTFGQKTAALRDQYDSTLSLCQQKHLAQQLLHLEHRQRNQVQQRALAENIPFSGVTPEGQAFILSGFVDGNPQYIQDANMNTAARSTGVAPFVRWNSDFDPVVGSGIDGTGLYASVMEVGNLHVDHPEFYDDEGSPRFTAHGLDGTFNSHATQVNSAVGAWGKDSNAIGIAPRVSLRSYGRAPGNSAVYGSGMAHPSQHHASIVSNRSTAGTFGSISYSHASRDLDRALNDLPYHSFVNSAGNNGSAYATLGGGQTNAKNGLTAGEIGTLNRDDDGNYLSGGSLAGGSSRGPTSDGRIKPELVAHGTSVRVADGTSGYRSMSGTSFSAPVITGSIVLLADYFQRRFPERMLRSASIRALLINGADDLGNPGPDYRYGFGAVNVLASASMIRDYANNPTRRTIVEDALSENATWSHTYHVESMQDVRVALSWLDPAYSGQTSGRVLINNLHIRIIGPDSEEHLPFTMPFAENTSNTSLYSAHAIRGVNNVDPNLLVEIPDAAPGTYTIEVFHSDALLDETPQEFSLAVSGMQASTVANPTFAPDQAPTTISKRSPTEIFIPVSDMLVGATAQLKKMGSSPITITALGRRSGQLWMVVDTSAMEAGYWDLHLSNPDGSKAVLKQAILINAHPRFELFWDMQDDPGFTFANNTAEAQWEFGSPGEHIHEPLYGPFGPQVLGTNINGPITAQYDISAISPVIDLSNASNLSLRVHHWINKPSWISSDLDVRINNGDWQSLYHSSGLNRWNKWQILSDQNPWNEAPIPLDASVNGQEQVQFRFRLYSGEHASTEEHIGWYIGGFELREDNVPVRYPPVFTSDPVVDTPAETNYQYTATVDDQDTPHDALSWSLTQAPSWLSLSPSSDGTAVLQGTAKAGTYDIAITVSDGDYHTHQHYTLTVHGEAGDTFSLTYDGNQADSGSVPEDTNPYLAGQEVTVSSNSANLYRTDHALVGWNTSADGTGERYRPSDTLIMPAADLTLFAEWAPGRVISMQVLEGVIWEITPYPLYNPESSEDDTWQIFQPVGQNDEHLLRLKPGEPN